MFQRQRRTWPEAGSRHGLRRDPPGTPPGEGLPTPGWIRGGVLYCLFLRDFTPHGTLEAARARLAELRGLGADAIWLLPIHPIGVARRKGTLGSPYAIRDYYAVNPDYGTEADLKRFVDEAHGLGLRVIIDLVVNHAGCDHPFVAQHPSAFCRDRLGRPTRRYTDWRDVIDWNFEEPRVTEHLLGAITHWVADVGIDGYRCDVAGMVPRPFWRAVHDRLTTLKPDHYLLAEWDDPELHRVAFHSTYDWEFYRQLRRARYGLLPGARLARTLAARHADFPAGADPLRYVENHDEARAGRRFGPLTAAATVFTALAGGVFLIYNGQEVGARHRPSLFEREPIEWDPPGGAMARAFISGLATLHQRFRAFGPPEPLDMGPARELAGYRRRGPAGEPLLVLMNLGRRPAALPGELMEEVAGARLECLSRARMTGPEPRDLPGRSTVIWAPAGGSEK